MTEPKIVNLFGELALEETMQLINSNITALLTVINQLSTNNLTEEKLREVPLEVNIIESQLTKEVTLNSLVNLSSAIKDLITTINENVNKFTYDAGTGNLKTLNTPSGTQTVAISSSNNTVVSQTYVGNNHTYGSGLLMSRLAFNQTLNRLEFS